MRRIVTISLPEASANQIDSLVAHGGYVSTSEMFRDMLRDWAKTSAAPRFRTASFIRAVKKHARRDAAKNLSRNHDRYLYGA